MITNLNKSNGKNSLTSKLHNRGLVLRLIASGTCRTRIDLSRQTGLTKSTLTNIISEFIQSGFVTETEVTNNEVCGRNPICLDISEHAPKVIGLLIFRDRAEAVLCDLKMTVLREECIVFDQLTEEELIRICFRLIDKVKEGETNLLGIGVASIGPLDRHKGLIINPPDFFGIHHVEILRILQEHYSLPVLLEHDNNCAALAEKLYGNGRNAQDFIFLGVSNGIGSGLICNGEIYHNRSGLGSEMGHVSIQRDGLLCPCGNRGCLWMYASTPVIMRQLKVATGLDLSYGEFCRQSKMTAEDDRPSTPDITEKTIDVSAFSDNDLGTDTMSASPDNAIWTVRTTSQIFTEMFENISVALVSMVNMFQPEMILLGHDCMDWTDEQILWLEQRINERKIASDDYHISIRKAAFGKKALVVGAACLIADQVFAGNLSISCDNSL